MKLTNEIFARYRASGDKQIIKMSEDLGYENAADFEEDIYIWSLFHADKSKVMQFFEMSESEYAEHRELWADESKRCTA
jgi:hypothetical protein